MMDVYLLNRNFFLSNITFPLDSKEYFKKSRRKNQQETTISIGVTIVQQMCDKKVEESGKKDTVNLIEKKLNRS